jgi:Kef-type K+ transport system membrane component KefB
MSAMSFDGLLIISVIAVAAPVIAASVRRVKLPSVVVEIAAGIVVGPSVLAWVRIDQPVTVIALLGLAFLLFLAGLEIDLRATAPSQARQPCPASRASRPPAAPWPYPTGAASWPAPAASCTIPAR